MFKIVSSLRLFRISDSEFRASQVGASLVEVLVAIALTGILLPAFAEAVLTSSAARPAAAQRLQALSLEREAMEAVRVVREAGWSNIATDGTYHPVISSNSWSLVSGSETLGNFTRQIVISSVQRDSSNNIVSSGGTTDPSTKHVVVTIAWTKPIATSISSDTYLTRWQNNATWTQTTQADFNAGTLNNTVVTNTSGGEVQLNGGGSGASWAAPSQAGAYNASGNTDATSVYVDSSTNRAYLTVGTILYILNVANAASPALLGSINTSNQLYGVYVVGNYAYLASANNTGELTIINVSNPAAPTQASAFNLGDTADAKCVYVSGNYAYVGKVLSTTSGINEFYIVNIATPTAPTLTGSLNLTADVNSVTVSGSYAYLATSVTTAELTIVNISTPASPTIAGTYNSAGTAFASSVYKGSIYLYMTELNNTGGPEFFILNVANPASVSLVGSYELGADAYSVYTVGSEAFLATAANGQQFAVLDLSNVASPVLEGSSNLSTNNDVFVVNNLAYLASTSNNSELIIMQPTASQGGQSASGDYTSQTFDAGAVVGFNSLSFTTTQPSGTSITFQIATNNDNATWNYVGPDGTAFTQYSTAGNIALAKINARYFRFKASLSTNSKSILPIIYDVTLNYSP